MRIVWQNEHYPDAVKGGGGTINTAYITRAMARLGACPVILARGPAGRELTAERVDGVRVWRMPPPALPPSAWPVWPLLELVYLRRPLMRLARHFDLFVCIDAAYAVSFKRARPARPMVYRVEGTWRSAGRPGMDGCARRLRALRKNAYIRLLHACTDYVERLAWRRADAIVVKSQFMRQDLTGTHGIPPDKIHVIPNGVDHARFADATPSPQTLERLARDGRGTTTVMYCGRLVEVKNLGLLLQAFSQMRQGARCLLVLVGDGDQRDDLRRHAERLGISERTRFVGHTAHVEEFLAAADIFVLPSTYESFGNALVEAMAAGLPCVALRPDFISVRTASQEIIDSGRTGFLVESRPEALAATLDRLVDDPVLRRTVGLAAQHVAETRYCWSSCARDYLALGVRDGHLAGAGAAER